MEHEDTTAGGPGERASRVAERRAGPGTVPGPALVALLAWFGCGSAAPNRHGQSDGVARPVSLAESHVHPSVGAGTPDHGVLLWGGVQTRIAGVRKGDDLQLVPVEGDPLPAVGTSVRGAVEDERRTALMRTHSGLHLLSGVVYRDFGSLVTGGNMEPLAARMDFNLPEVPDGFKERVAEACAAEVAADRAIEVGSLPRDEAFAYFAPGSQEVVVEDLERLYENGEIDDAFRNAGFLARLDQIQSRQRHVFAGFDDDRISAN